jgi:hypothetical protein
MGGEIAQTMYVHMNKLIKKKDWDQIKKTFLLIYNSCTRGSIVTFPYMPTMHCGLVQPSIILSDPPSPFSND